jgi:hypothetical protein
MFFHILSQRGTDACFVLPALSSEPLQQVSVDAKRYLPFDRSVESATNGVCEVIGALREAVRRSRRERPCYRDGWVVLTEPLHCIITLPEGDDDSCAGRGIYPIPSAFWLRRIA